MKHVRQIKAIYHPGGRSIFLGKPVTDIVGKSKRGENVRLLLDEDKKHTVVVQFYNKKTKKWGDDDGTSEL